MDGYDMTTVYKPWGKEEWLELNEFYCYKRIYINAGNRTSLQFHEKKVETNYIISGTAEIWLEDDFGIIQKKIMKEGQFFNVKPFNKHRVVALTDVILQEVSTPEVDDVIRVEDDNNRPNGKIDTEYQTPSVLILCAGIGSRMQSISKNINKVLLPINNKAVISYIIEKFPKEWEIIIAVGYTGELVQEYCDLAHQDRNIKYVYIDDYTSNVSGPGYSALQCKNYLQKPFYFVTGDAIIEDDIPPLLNNWIGISPTNFSEKYSTVLIVDNIVKEFKNKSSSGFAHAFIGIAGILDYQTFWASLEKNIKSLGELVSAFENISDYTSIEAKQLTWFDTGNVDDFLKARKYFKDAPLSLIKDTGDCVYKIEDKFIKYFSNTETLKNVKSRWEKIKHLTPDNIIFKNNFMSYTWINGKNLYNMSDETVFRDFLLFLDHYATPDDIISEEDYTKFYLHKTQKRIQSFIKKYGEKYYTSSYLINQKNLPSMKDILEKIDMPVLLDNPITDNFHGDLQFANIIYEESSKKFTYIDWRDSFGNNVNAGDIYYDFAKLLGGMIIPYDAIKNESNFFTYESGMEFYYYYDTPDILKTCRTMYNTWLKEKMYDTNKVLLITGLIFLNMSPLHEDKFSKMLWFMAMELLYDYNNRN
jgi:NDP-sugar pyrophosphorylase family protein/mannose-6-phosphate isomerase-like protein (cupin superfamily)